MSMHKKPLTELERSGLKAHGLDVGTPSQLSDAFRQGVAWAQVELDEEIAQLRDEDGECALDIRLLAEKVQRLTAERDALAVELETIKAHATQNSVKNWLALPAELRAMSMSVMLKRDSEQCRRIAELERLAASRAPAEWHEIERLCDGIGSYQGSIWRAAEKYHGIT